MPTYVLEGAGRAVFPRRPIVVSMTIVGEANCAVMQVLVDGVENRSTVRPTPGLMVLPRVDALTVLRIAPAGARSEFPSGTSIHLAMTVEDRSDPDPERAVLGPIDISGLTHIDVATLDSAADGVVASALRSGPEVELGPIASYARATSRGVLGVDQLPERLQLGIVLAIDLSASMLSSITDGTLDAVCDVVVGLASVVSPHAVPRVCLVGHELTWVDVDSLETMAADVARTIRGAMLVSGFRASLVPIPDKTDTVTFVVTDGVPADQPLLAHDSTDGRHLIAITSTPRSIDGQSANVTVVTPPQLGAAGAQRFAGSRETVTALTRSLLTRSILADRGPTAVAAR